MTLCSFSEDVAVYIAVADVAVFSFALSQNAESSLYFSEVNQGTHQRGKHRRFQIIGLDLFQHIITLLNVFYYLNEKHVHVYQSYVLKTYICKMY